MHCNYYSSLATETLQFPISDMITTLKDNMIPNEISNANLASDDIEVTEKANRVIGKMNSFLKRITSECFGKGLIMGNIDAENSLKIVNIIDKTFQFKPLDVSLQSRRRIVKLPLSSSLKPTEGKVMKGLRLSHVEPNENDENSAVSFIFQLSTRSVKDQMLVELLGDAVEQSFYNSLRTRQQLGYIVASNVRSRDGLYSLVFTVQSAIVSGDELTSRIDKFINDICEELVQISDEALNEYKDGLIVQKLDPDQRLSSQAARFWSESIIPPIETSTSDSAPPMTLPIFNRYESEVRTLKDISTTDFGNFVRDFLSYRGEKRRLLVSQITSKKWLNNSRNKITKSNKNDSKKSGSNDLYYEEVVNEIEFRDDLPLID